MKKITKIVAPALLVLVGLGIDNVNRVNALGDIGPTDPATTLTSTTYRPDSLGEMKLSSQKVYELDDNLNRLSYKSYCYSSEEGKLLPDYKKDSTFDSKNRVTSETEYLYDGEVESCWRRSTYQYEGKYNYTIMGESYDGSKSAFVPSFKNVFTYDDNGFLTSFKDYGYYDQGYVMLIEDVFTSSNNGLTINQEQRYYEDGQLDRITDYTMTYDSLGREVEKLYTYWDDLAKTQSDNKSKSITTYTDDTVETTYYYYDKISGSFKIEYKDSTQSNHDAWVYKFYSYSEANEEFSLNSTYTYTFEYDENGNVAKSLSTVKRGSNEPKADSETYFTHKIVTKKGGLGGGAIAAIVIGGIILLFVGLFFVWKYELEKKAAKEGAKRILKIFDVVYKPINELLFDVKEEQK